MADLDRINGLSDEAFAAEFGFLFEHSPWVVARAAQLRPFAHGEAMLAALLGTLAGAAEDEKLALLRAHPKLADKAAVQAGLTAESSAEQASAGLNALSEDEYRRFHELNAAYEARFGFPFIIAVRRAGSKAAILAAMQARLDRDPATEFATALNEVGHIVHFRLQEKLAGDLA